MWRYVARRLLLTLPVLVGITVLVFFIFHFTADPADVILGNHATAAAKAQLRAELGLNDPVWVQYGRFAAGLMRGDLGRSWFLRTPVAHEIALHFPHTVELTITALLLTALLGVVFGVLAAVYHYSWLDHTVVTLTLIGASMPTFWIGLMLIQIFSVRFSLLPLDGRISADLLNAGSLHGGFYILTALFSGRWHTLWDLLRHLALPAAALTLVSTALVTRMTRAGMLEVLRQDFIRTARAKGLGDRVIVYRHALRNALIPVVTVLGLQFGQLLGGAVITETIFSWPGLGTLVINAVQNQDLPLVQGAVLLVALIFSVGNLLVDLSYGLLDPRIRYS